MKKELIKTVHCCDACGKEQDYIERCLSCGVEHCHDCEKRCGREYKHGVYVSGSGDGYYCLECDAKLTATGADDRHTAYRKIAYLRVEERAWSADFKQRKEIAEQELQRLSVKAKP